MRSQVESVSDKLLQAGISVMEQGMAPDFAIRVTIRQLLTRRARELSGPPSELARRESAYVNSLRVSPLAVHTEEANRQHYEVPAAFFHLVLGQHKKYSCALFETPDVTLSQAEQAALTETIERAELKDGMEILELGCGWGSLSLEMAKRFPKSRIVAISNSHGQKSYIDELARTRGLKNLTVAVRDIGTFKDVHTEFGHFDRIVSVEMFEHLRNYELLFRRINTWLKPNGKLFVHIFTHKSGSYFFDTEGTDNWMGRYFFTGGQMPSQSLLAEFQRDLRLEKQWSWNGAHYSKTSEAWLANLDSGRDQALKILAGTYGEKNALVWLNRWRVFFIACSELFNFRDGEEWFVSHYRFRKAGE